MENDILGLGMPWQTGHSHDIACQYHQESSPRINLDVTNRNLEVARPAVQGRVAQTDNVHAALALVATGEAPFGIVYATDAVAEPRVSVIGAFPEVSHPPIVYPAAAVAGGDIPLAELFLAFLSSDTARSIFQRDGFVALDE